MADFTKKAIRNSFLKLLNEKPLKQITVRDIVDDCGVNRNTFYYHFQDIPQLIETIIREDAEQIISDHPTITCLEEYLDAAIALAVNNRTAIMHIYRSVDRNLYEQYQWKVCRHAAEAFISQILTGRNVSDTDRNMLVDYIKCVCFGIIMGWLEDGMKADIQDYAHRLCVLKQGDLEQMIDRLEQP